MKAARNAEIGVLRRWVDLVYGSLWGALGLVCWGAVALDWRVFLYSPGPGPFLFIAFGLFCVVVGVGHIRAWRFSRLLDALGGTLFLVYAIAMFLSLRQDLGEVGRTVVLGSAGLAMGIWGIISAKRGFRRAA